MGKLSFYLKSLFMVCALVYPFVSFADICSVNEVMVSQYPFDEPGRMASAHDGKFLFVTDETACTVMIIDTSANIVSNQILLDFVPYDVVVSDDGKRLYVSAMFENRISVVDISDTKFENWGIVDTWNLESEPSASGLGTMALDGDLLYVADLASNYM